MEQNKIPLNVTVYTPGSALRHPGALILNISRSLIASRHLASRLAIRDIKAMYRQTFLGYIWAFLLPVVNALTWLFMKSSGIINIQETGVPYPIWVISGVILWQIFTEALQSPLAEVGAGKNLLIKLNFPRESLIISGLLKNLFNAGIKVLVLTTVVWWLGIPPGLTFLPFLLGVLGLILVGNAIGIFLTPLGLLYTDIGKGIPVLTQFVMFITPVVFALPATGWSKTLFMWNILTPLIVTTREWLVGQSPTMLGYFSVVILISLLAAFIGLIFYRVSIPILIERMGSV